MYLKSTAVAIMLSTDTAQLVVHQHEHSDLRAAITGSQKYVNCGLNGLAMLFCHQDFSTSDWYTCLRGTEQLCSENYLCREK